MLPEEYQDFTSEELAEELRDLDEVITNCQNALVKIRKQLNHNMDLREAVLDRQKQLSQQKGWK